MQTFVCDKFDQYRCSQSQNFEIYFAKCNNFSGSGSSLMHTNIQKGFYSSKRSHVSIIFFITYFFQLIYFRKREKDRKRNGGKGGKQGERRREEGREGGKEE